jgi:hypothetical protein
LPSRVWKACLAFALLFVFADSVARLSGVGALNDANSGGARTIAADSTTASGYAFNQHTAILPILGIDGYHWTVQTQQMLAEGTARIRHVDYDGPPAGRDVHWSSFLRWIAAGAATVVAATSDRSVAQAVESVAPWINTVLFCVLLVALVPVVARRFGPVPAAVLSVGMVAVYPSYELYAIGNFDHHGVASTATLVSVLCLLGGGAGFVRAGEPANARAAHDDLAALWILDRRNARAWFVASGVAGGVGLWISAATQLPALIAIGVAVLLGFAALSRSDNPSRPWRMDPTLWRVWGFAGAITSVAFFLIEYAPSHMAMRLEVNHPLYAVAWLGAGEVLSLLPTVVRTRRAIDMARLGLGVAFVVLLPAVALLDAQSFVLRPGAMIMALHEDYIDEFRSLPRQVASWSVTQLLAGVGFLPLIAGVPALAASFSKRVPEPLRALAMLAAMPALVFTVLAFRHGRWLNIGLVLWIATAVAVATIVRFLPWQSLRRAPARGWMAIAAVVAFAPFPLFSAYQWFTSAWTLAPTSSALTQVVVRDLSYKLRARLGNERGVIASAPTTTTWMLYFGGFRGVGTLYWENRDGIDANARLFGAAAGASDSRGASDALAVARQLGVTHIVIPSWAPFVTEYAPVARYPGPGIGERARRHTAQGRVRAAVDPGRGSDLAHAARISRTGDSRHSECVRIGTRAGTGADVEPGKCAVRAVRARDERRRDRREPAERVACIRSPGRAGAHRVGAVAAGRLNTGVVSRDATAGRRTRRGARQPRARGRHQPGHSVRNSRRLITRPHRSDACAAARR